MLGDLGLVNTNVEEFLYRAQSSGFDLVEGKIYPRLKGKYLNEDVTVVLHPSKNKEISETYIYFSASSILQTSVALCNTISEQIEEKYGAVVNTYLFDTINLEGEFDKISIAEIKKMISSRDIYVWLITSTRNEIIYLCLERKKGVYVPIIKIKDTKHTECSVPKQCDFLITHDIRKKGKPRKFLGTYTWKEENIQNLQLLSPVGILEIVERSGRKVYHKEDILTFSKEIKESYFKVQNDFLSGVYYDLSDDNAYSAYAFVLYFSVLDAFRYNENTDLTNFLTQIDVLCACCPIIKDYTCLMMCSSEKSIYPFLKNDRSILQILDWDATFEKYLTLSDYAQLILHRDEKEIELLRPFEDTISAPCVSKTAAKRYKVSNDILSQDFFEILLAVLKKMGGVEAAISECVKQMCIGDRKPVNQREGRKIQRICDDKMRFRDQICSSVVRNCVNKLYVKNNLIYDSDPNELNNYHWSYVDFTSVEHYIDEAVSEYYLTKEPQKGYIPVPRKKK